jgi:hypothetical protein
MGELPVNEEEQDMVSLTDMEFFPATVSEMTYDDDGMVLHTNDPDSETDIRVFDDARPATRLGELA